ncbi:MAG: TonB-dependent receptor [Pseudomonadota bacterium]
MRTPSLILGLPILLFAAQVTAQEKAQPTQQQVESTQALDDLLASSADSEATEAPTAQDPVSSTQEQAVEQAARQTDSAPVETQPTEEQAQSAQNADELLPTIPLPQRKQDVPQGVPEPPRAQIEEIIVTATKREMSARDVPVSINATSGETLEKMGARDVMDYITTIPGITLQDGPNGDAGGRKLTVRGVGPSEANGVSGNQTVGQFIGDIPMTDPYSNFVTPDLDPFDLQSVEVLKGPQGTYFGASALNGAIRYVPKKPVLGQWGMRGFAETLSINQGGRDQTYALAGNVPVGETLAFRATGVLQNTPGVIDNLQLNKKDADSRRKWSARGALRWQPSDPLEINLIYLKQQTRRNDLLDIDNEQQQFSNNHHPGPSSLESGFDLASIDARYDFGDWGTLVWQSSLQHKSSLGNLDTTLFTGAQGIPNLRSYTQAKIEGKTHELRLVSPGDGDWNWIAGVFLLNYKADVINDAYLPGTALPPVLAQLPFLTIFGPRGLSYGIVKTSPVAKETSLYGELTRKFGDSWDLTLGARFYKTRIAGSVITDGIGGLAVQDSIIDQRDKGISPKASLSYKPSDSFMMYATIARGFQFGGINSSTSGLPFDNPLTGPVVPPSFGSSSLWSREVGIRTDWFEKTLQADVVVYDLAWSDAQFVEYNDNPVIDTTYVSNVGKVKSQGVEASLIYLPPIDGVTLNIAAGYSSAKTASTYTAQNGTIVNSGTTMPNSPKWQAATTLAYNHMFGAWAAGGSLAYVYSGRAYDTILHDHDIFGYGAYNLGINLARPDLSFAPTLNFSVNNLTDKRGIVGRSSFSGDLAGLTGEETPSFIYIRPRAFSLRLSFSFE